MYKCTVWISPVYKIFKYILCWAKHNASKYATIMKVKLWITHELFPYSRGFTRAGYSIFWFVRFVHQMAFLKKPQRDLCLFQGLKWTYLIDYFGSCAAAHDEQCFISQLHPSKSVGGAWPSQQHQWVLSVDVLSPDFWEQDNTAPQQMTLNWFHYVLYCLFTFMVYICNENNT